MKNSKYNVTKVKDFQRIVLPVDGSESSTRAVEKALSLAKETRVDITALYVMEFPNLAIPELNYSYPDFNTSYTNIIKVIKKRGNEVLYEVKKKGLELGVNVKTKLVEGVPDDQIIKEGYRYLKLF